MKSIKEIYLVVATLLVAVGALVVMNAAGLNVFAAENQNPCTDDQIVRCGVTSKQDLLKKYRSNESNLQQIYKHYGITESTLTGAMTVGTVTRNGDVVANGKVVAKNAYSVSRIAYQSVDSGKQPTAVKIPGTSLTLYEGPDMGTFKKGIESVSAYIWLDKAGNYITAILSDCANPVITPPEPPKPPTPKPTFKCETLDSKMISRNIYDFTAKASVANGAVIESYTFNFGDGSQPVTIETNAATNTQRHTFTSDGNFTVKVTVKASKGTSTKITCETPITVGKAPTFKCENLTYDKISRDTYKFTATASAANGAVIENYSFDFGEGKPVVIATSAKSVTQEHTFKEARTYTVKVTVTAKVDGKTQADSTNCVQKITIGEEQTPSIEIEKTVNGKEHAKVQVGAEFTYEITVRNTGNVVLKNAVVTDNAPKQVTLLSARVGKITGNTWTYTIPELKVGESKSFTIKAKYGVYASGTHKNTVCVDTPSVPGSPDDCDDATTETDEPIKVCDLKDNTVKTIERNELDESHMTTDLSKCGDMKVCVIKDKTIKTIPKNQFNESTMTTNMDECAELPEELPQTGISPFIGGGLGIGSITAAGYYWAASRKNLLDALLKK